jgi:hypothetical protein
MILRWVAVAAVAVTAVLAGTIGYRLPDSCVGEDGGPYPCVWDGPTRGNRTGDRVIIRTRP